jgi:metallo-beta-lactamase class B
MSRHFIAAVVLVAAAAPSNAQGQKPPPSLGKAPEALKWNVPAEPLRIAGPVYFVGTEGLGVFLITTPEGHILINTGMPPSGPMIAASIQKLGFKSDDVRLLLVGHAHVDHAGGHAYMRQFTGAKVAVIAEEKELLESGGKTDFLYGKYPEFWFDPVQVDQVFHDGDTLRVGDVAIIARLTSGHTRGSTSFVTRIVDNGTSYTVVFPTSTGINPGTRFIDQPSYPGIAEDYRRTLQVLEGLAPDIWLFPHNEAYGFAAKRARVATEGVQAWVDPSGYREWVAAQRSRFESEIASETTRQGKGGQ